MPELPEVEVVRQTLLSKLLQLKIKKVSCSYEPIIQNDFSFFKTKVEGRKIIDIKRYAKYLIFVLEDGALLSHLRMEGKYFYLRNHQPVSKHVHVIFELDNGYTLQYEDVRKFGRIEYKPLDQIYTTLPLLRVGIEANQPNPNLEELYAKLKRKKIPIKTALLDQSIISGLGNIYVDEVLFKAHIHPLRATDSLTLSELNNILVCSRETLDAAILHKGTTIRSYTSSLGVMGEYQDFLMVHTKENCPTCGKALEKVKIGGRTSYFCKACQR